MTLNVKMEITGGNTVKVDKNWAHLQLGFVLEVSVTALKEVDANGLVVRVTEAKYDAKNIVSRAGGFWSFLNPILSFFIHLFKGDFHGTLNEFVGQTYTLIPVTYFNSSSAAGIVDGADSEAEAEAVIQSVPMEYNFTYEDLDEYDLIGRTVGQYKALVIDVDFLHGYYTNGEFDPLYQGVFPDILPISEQSFQWGGFAPNDLSMYYSINHWNNSLNWEERVDKAFEFISNSGFSLVRIGADWNWITPTINNIDSSLNPDNITEQDVNEYINQIEADNGWVKIDHAITSALSYGLVPYVVLGNGHSDKQPKYNGNIIAPGNVRGDNSEHYIGVAENVYLYWLKLYARAVVQKFPQINIWQAENELNAARFAEVYDWWRKGDAWADEDPGGFQDKVAQLIYDAVKFESANQDLVLQDFHVFTLTKRLNDWKDYYDIVGINVYPNEVFAFPVMGYLVGEVVWAARRALKSFGTGYKDKPVWVIETAYGAYTGDTPPTELNERLAHYNYNNQAKFLKEALNSSAKFGAKAFNWFRLMTKDNTEDSPFSTLSDINGYSGLFDPSGEPKPALHAYIGSFANNSDGEIATFANRYGDEIIGGTLSLIDVLDGIQSNSSFRLDATTEFTIKTDSEWLPGGDDIVIHQDWNHIPQKYELKKTFNLSVGDDPEQFAQFDHTFPIHFEVDLGGENYSYIAKDIRIRDPWFVDANKKQENKFRSLYSTTDTTIYHVFLNQNEEFNDIDPIYTLSKSHNIYYAVNDGIYVFSHWNAENAVFDANGSTTTTNNNTQVAFLSENAKIKAVFEPVNEIPDYTLSIIDHKTLSIPPGASIEFAPGFKIEVLGHGTLTLLGDQDNPILLTSNGSGNWDGIDVRNDGVVNTSHVTIKNANNGLKYGFWDNVTNNPPDKYISNVKFEDNETAVLVEFRNCANFFQSDIYINGCTFNENVSGIKFEHNPQYPSPTVEQTNAFISNSTFSNNDVGVSLQRNADYVDIVSSQFHGNNKGIDVFIEWSPAERLNHHFDISRNVFTESNDGIFISTDCSNGSLNILNNTFYNNSSNVFSLISEDQFNTKFFNNIVYGGYAVNLDLGDQIHYNDFWETDDTYYPAGGTGNLHANPLFVDAASGNYTLHPSSPCIDAGNPNSPLDPDGTTADIGAFPFLHYSGEVTGELADGYTLYRNVIISGDVWLPANASVTIAPNTDISFLPEASLEIQGTLTSDGTDGSTSFDLNGSSILVAGEADFVNTSFTNGKLHFEGDAGTGSVYASSFTDASLVINEGAFATVRNTSFTGGAVGLMTSGINTSPTISNCTFTDHDIAIIAYYHSSPIIRGCTLSNSGVGIHTAESAIPVLTNGGVSARACTFKNNIIKECAVAVQAWRHSTVNLGHGPYGRPPDNISYDLLGYNTLHSNGLLFDNERSTIYAIGNNWSSQSCSFTGPYNNGDTPENIFWEPVLADLVPAPDIANIDELFEKASKFEAMGEFEVALDFYTQIVMAIPNDKLGELSLYGLARCYKSLVQEEAMIQSLVSIYGQFPGTGVHKHAHSLLSSHKIKDGELAMLLEAEGHIHTIRTEYPYNEMEPKLLYEEFLIAKKRGDGPLGRTTAGSHVQVSSKEVYRKLKENFPDSPFTFLAGLESGNRKKTTSIPSVPASFTLYPAYPNPFNPATTIRFVAVETLHATSLNVYDVTGRIVETLLNEPIAPGTHEIIWNAETSSTGVYFIVLTSGEEQHVQKIVLMK